jgi:cytochrome c
MTPPALLLLLLLPAAAAAADLRGHGGPVGALAVQGDAVLSGSFDTRAILWDAGTGQARRVLRTHEGNVTAVAFLPGGWLATGGQDGRVALWDEAGLVPVRSEAAHGTPVGVLAVSPDGGTLASAGWDGSLRLARLDGTGAAGFAAHQGKITGLAWLDDGRLASIGSDLRLRLWSGTRLDGGFDLPAPPNALAPVADGLAVAFADGAVRRYGLDGRLLAEARPSDRPLVALAAGEGLLAASGIAGTVFVLDAADLSPRQTLVPGQGPVWSLALAGGTLMTGGGDGAIRLWQAATGTPLGNPPLPAATGHQDGSRGAEVWKACAVCHTLTPDDGSRAGPTLHGVFGRRIGTAPGFAYSEALMAMDIVWTPETVAALFEHGPEAYTPGSRMPEQRLPDPADRAALVAFLERHAR